ncbi:hypothetical protein AAFF_G00148350, partial [Aldrovandia affinis]
MGCQCHHVWQGVWLILGAAARPSAVSPQNPAYYSPLLRHPHHGETVGLHEHDSGCVGGTPPPPPPAFVHLSLFWRRRLTPPGSMVGQTSDSDSTLEEMS